VYGQAIDVLPVLDWRLLHNTGAAFSFLSDAGGWQRYLFTGISAVASVVFLVWLIRLPKEQWLVRFSLTFILGGAIGNLVDRIQHGYVVDFISVHWHSSYFPAFNIADMAITFGAILMIADMLFNPEHKRQK
jgi:signal peptidase II